MAPTIMTITEVGTDVGGVQAFCCAWPAGGRGGGVTAQELDVASAKNQNDP